MLQSFLPFEINDNNYHELVKKLVTDTRKVTRGTNIQNIPSRTEQGIRVRKCFIPPEGWVLISADLGQIEPRIQAHIMYTEYGDDSLLNIFISGQKLYESMAAMTFNIPIEYCKDKVWYDPVSGQHGKLTPDTPSYPPTAFFPRAMMKTGVLAKGYLQTPKRFAENMKVSMETSEMFFRKFDESFPSFSVMVQDTIEFMKQNGYVPTLFGRKRRYPMYQYYAALAEQNEPKLQKLYRERKQLMNKGHEMELSKVDKDRLKKINEEIDELRKPHRKMMAMEREAFNGRIQGTGADIIKMNGNEMKKVCYEKDWLMPGSIHDEILVALPEKDVTPENIELINKIMTETVKLAVPLESDIVIMPRWMEEYKPEEWFAKFGA